MLGSEPGGSGGRHICKNQGQKAMKMAVSSKSLGVGLIALTFTRVGSC